MWKDIDTFTGIRAKISPIIRTSHFMMAIMGSGLVNVKKKIA